MENITLVNPRLKNLHSLTEKFWTVGVYDDWPPVYPLSLIWIASLLREKFDVNVIDADVEDWDEKKVASKIDSDIVVITSAPYIRWQGIPFTLKHVQRTIAAIRGKSDAKIVLTGPHGTMLTHVVTKAVDFDYLVLGEPEVRTAMLVEAITNKKQPKVDGIVIKNKNKITTRPLKNNLIDLKKLPQPAFDLLPIKKYTIRNMICGLTITSRGCPYGCIFCTKSLINNAYRTRTVDSVIHDFKTLQNLGVECVYFADQLFGYDQIFLKNLLQRMVDKGLEIPWACETRLDCVNKELLKSMKRAGLFQVLYGLEAANPSLQRKIKKNMELEPALVNLQTTIDLNIDCILSLVLFSPGETISTLLENLKIIRQFKPFLVDINVCTPLPDSELFQKQFGGGINDFMNIAKAAGTYGNRFDPITIRVFYLLFSLLARLSR